MLERGLRDSVRQAARAIRGAKKIIIASHKHPDGDTIGCQLALGLGLLQQGKKVILLCPDPVPARFQFLQGSELIGSSSQETADVAIAVDCGSAKRLGALQGIFFKAKTTIQIDHHDFGDAFGKVQVLETEASAVGEIVYELLRALKIDITQAIATCLLTSIVVDTGSFRFSNIRAKTFDLCGKLIRKGVDLQHLIEESYWKKSRPMAKLSSHCILHAEYSPGGQVAWAVVHQKDIERYGARLDDADAVTDDLRSIEGVKVAALFREIDGKNYRVSLRSKYGINVAAVARLFGGGGHRHSAGCLVHQLERDKARILAELKDLTESF